MIRVNKRISTFLFVLLAWGVFSQKSDSLTKPKNLTLRQFSRLADNSKKPVLLCFCADTCCVCKIQEEVLEQIALERHRDMDVVWINLPDNPKIAEYFEITSVPVLILYLKGYPVWLRYQAYEKEKIIEYIAPYIVSQ